MRKVTIICDDCLVGVDGEFRRVSLHDMDPEIHAVQWNGESGWVEYKNRPPRKLNSIGEFLPILDRFDLVAPPAPSPETSQQQAQRELQRLRGIAVEELETRRLELALRAEAERVTGAASAKAYIAALDELAEAQAGKPGR